MYFSYGIFLTLKLYILIYFLSYLGNSLTGATDHNIWVSEFLMLSKCLTFNQPLLDCMEYGCYRKSTRLTLKKTHIFFISCLEGVLAEKKGNTNWVGVSARKYDVTILFCKISHFMLSNVFQSLGLLSSCCLIVSFWRLSLIAHAMTLGGEIEKMLPGRLHQGNL